MALPKDSKYQILDSNGLVISEIESLHTGEEINVSSLDISGLRKGLYFLKSTNGSSDTTSTNNYIQLTKIDKKKCEISGVFNLRLKLISDDGDGPTPPETIEFTNGQFRSRVKREWIE